MTKPPTLLDAVYRTSFKNDWQKWRAPITSARRFALDDRMSAFLADLSTEAFTKNVPHHQPVTSLSSPRNVRMVEALRTSARLPHATTWIEYNLRLTQARTNELLKRAPVPPEQLPRIEGWLLQQHPKIETAFTAHVFAYDDVPAHPIWLFPLAIAWTVDQDTVLPWKPLPVAANSLSFSEVATGIRGYCTDRISYVYSDFVETPNRPEAVSSLLREWSGVLRRIFALLATVNDLPVLITEAAVSKGFVARGQYRKFLSHKTLTLNVPDRLYRKTIRAALAMAHRRAHSVRGHWRRNWRSPLSPLCDHEWTASPTHLTCNRCHGQKTWIVEHVRGDASVGFVTHDYVVTHDT